MSVTRRFSVTPPAFFSFCCKQKPLANSTLGWPLRHAWVALGWPRRHPNPSPVGQRGPPPGVSHLIPLWRSFERCGLKSPQFGLDFSDLASIGVEFWGCFTKYQVPITNSLFLSKIVQRTTFSLWSEFLNLPFVRLYVKRNLRKSSSNPVEGTAIYGREKGCSDKSFPCAAGSRAVKRSGLENTSEAN